MSAPGGTPRLDLDAALRLADRLYDRHGPSPETEAADTIRALVSAARTTPTHAPSSPVSGVPFDPDTAAIPDLTDQEADDFMDAMAFLRGPGRAPTHADAVQRVTDALEREFGYTLGDTRDIAEVAVAALTEHTEETA